MTDTTVPGLLIYDADCGFCTSSARWFADKAGSQSAIAPWQATDLDAHGITATQASQAVQWSSSGRVTAGAAAIANALSTLSGLWRGIGIALAMPPISWLAAAAYPLIARNRHRLPGATDACRLSP